MPSLKQINCAIYLTDSSSTALAEYDTTYGDGIVNTFIAVPSHPSGFFLRLNSTGYIADGLGAFVFIDGKYQCNRVRRGLVLGKREDVSFTFRQQETPVDGRFEVRDWRFEDLNVNEADKCVETASSEAVGTIAVVVLRCKSECAQEDLAPRAAAKAIPKITVTKNDSGKAKSKQKARQSPKAPTVVSIAEDDSGSVGDFGGLFDGSADSCPVSLYKQTLVDNAGRKRFEYGQGSYQNESFYYDGRALDYHSPHPRSRVSQLRGYVDSPPISPRTPPRHLDKVRRDQRDDRDARRDSRHGDGSPLPRVVSQPERYVQQASHDREYPSHREPRRPAERASSLPRHRSHRALSTSHHHEYTDSDSDIAAEYHQRQFSRATYDGNNSHLTARSRDDEWLHPNASHISRRSVSFEPASVVSGRGGPRRTSVLEPWPAFEDDNRSRVSHHDNRVYETGRPRQSSNDPFDRSRADRHQPDPFHGHDNSRGREPSHPDPFGPYHDTTHRRRTSSLSPLAPHFSDPFANSPQRQSNVEGRSGQDWINESLVTQARHSPHRSQVANPFDSQISNQTRANSINLNDIDNWGSVSALSARKEPVNPGQSRCPDVSWEPQPLHPSRTSHYGSIALLSPSLCGNKSCHGYISHVPSGQPNIHCHHCPGPQSHHGAIQEPLKSRSNTHQAPVDNVWAAAPAAVSSRPASRALTYVSAARPPSRAATHVSHRSQAKLAPSVHGSVRSHRPTNASAAPPLLQDLTQSNNDWGQSNNQATDAAPADAWGTTVVADTSGGDAWATTNNNTSNANDRPTDAWGTEQLAQGSAQADAWGADANTTAQNDWSTGEQNGSNEKKNAWGSSETKQNDDWANGNEKGGEVVKDDGWGNGTGAEEKKDDGWGNTTGTEEKKGDGWGNSNTDTNANTNWSNEKKDEANQTSSWDNAGTQNDKTAAATGWGNTAGDANAATQDQNADAWDNTNNAASGDANDGNAASANGWDTNAQATTTQDNDGWGSSGNDTTNQNTSNDAAWGNETVGQASADANAWGNGTGEQNDAANTAWGADANATSGGNDGWNTNDNNNNNNTTTANNNTGWETSNNQTTAQPPTASAPPPTTNTTAAPAPSANPARPSNSSRRRAERHRTVTIIAPESLAKPAWLGQSAATTTTSAPPAPTSTSASAPKASNTKPPQPYYHRTARPSYHDSMRNPYAVFVFKYRSVAFLESLGVMTAEGKLGVKEAERRAEVERRVRGMRRGDVERELVDVLVQGGEGKGEGGKGAGVEMSGALIAADATGAAPATAEPAANTWETTPAPAPASDGWGADTTNNTPAADAAQNTNNGGGWDNTTTTTTPAPAPTSQNSTNGGWDTTATATAAPTNGDGWDNNNAQDANTGNDGWNSTPAADANTVNGGGWDSMQAAEGNAPANEGGEVVGTW